MVMETPPSPQCVGREFVRQYYTLLHEAPAHLHRFYNNSSSFIHGGLDPPNREPAPCVVGQRQIHQKIQQLNFRDCHAKIAQVDSQATLGNGVVVQVTGELSNGGQPMRRFTQTFVLAFQAPKKYYVHNDIFRYQDVLSEDGYDEVSRNWVNDNQSSISSQHASETSNNNMKLDHDDDGEYGSGNGGSTMPTLMNGTAEHMHHHRRVEEDMIQQLTTTMEARAQPVEPRAQSVEPRAQPIEQRASPMEQRAPPLEQRPSSIEPRSAPMEPRGHMPSLQQMPAEHHVDEPSPPTKDNSDRHTPHHSIDTYEPAKEPEHAQPTSPVLSAMECVTENTEVKTYANLVKGSSSGGQIYVPPSPAPMPRPPSPVTEAVKPPRTQRNSFFRPQSDFEPINTNESVNMNSGENDRRRNTYSDNHQLFLGNVPLSATEAQLKEIFGKFGTIVDLRVLSKASSNKSPNRGPVKVPNYGFITFEDPSSVQAVLSSRPIVYPYEQGVKLNVEEKKTKGIRGGGEGLGRGGRGGARGLVRPMPNSARPPTQQAPPKYRR